MKVKTITIDTNCINTRQGKKAINELEQLHNKGLIEIVKTDVMDTELSDSSPAFREKALKKSQNYHEDMGVAIIGQSRIGHCYIAGESNGDILKGITELLFPQYDKLGNERKKRAVRDSMHLSTHKMHKREKP